MLQNYNNLGLKEIGARPAACVTLGYVHICVGVGPISPKVLRACATSLCEPIAALFNQSLLTGSLLAEWKKHQIIPIPKKGDLSQICNYRPIFLLCVLSKVLESILFSKIIDFIRPKLSSHQFGFLAKRSSIAQLLTCYSETMDSLEHKCATDVLYLDLKKAFDSVPHNELLFKLWRIVVTDHLWSWFQGYLSDRHHFVQYIGAASACLPVVSGVPQGSVLGPLLFLIYIDDIPTAISCSSIYLFADDAKVVKSVASERLQDDLKSICGWNIDWKVFLNAPICTSP